MALFAGRGFDRTRLVHVAEQAGVSHGTVGVYFSTKRSLLICVVERLSALELGELRKLIDAHDCVTSELLVALGRICLARIEALHPVLRVIKAELGGFGRWRSGIANACSTPSSTCSCR